jgi:hypothetical protein
MRNPLRVSLAAVLILFGSASARSQLIDTFGEPVAPVGGMVIFSATPSDPVQLTTMSDSGALGGNRGVYGQREVTVGDTNAVNFEIGGQQQFRVVNSTSSNASAQLLYGFGSFTNGDAAQEAAVQSGNYTSLSLPVRSLNSSFDPAGAFAFEYQNNGIVTDFRITVVSGRNEGTATTFSSELFVLPQSTSDTTFVVPFSSFGGTSSATFGDIDQIVFSFGMIPPNTVLAIDNLRGMCAVPEPSSLAIIGLAGAMGFGGWMWRRRRAG